MTAVTIPAELLDDVAARGWAYRPDVEDGADVLALAIIDRGVHRVGRVVTAREPSRMVDGALIVRYSDGDTVYATAWALVGSVDGGPRPDFGQRVLVLDHPADVRWRPVGVRVVRRITEAAGRLHVAVEGDAPGFWPLINRWALLPDAAESDDVAARRRFVDEVRGDIEELRALGFTRPAGIPPGRWRQGSHAPRNLWIGGAHPEGVDVGRMDTPELAAHVVDAVNALRDAEPRDLTREESAAIRSRPLPPALADAGIDALRDHIRYLDWLRERRSTGITREELLATRKERDDARETLARLRGFVEAEHDRYNNARTGERDDCRGDKADALDQVVDWLDDNGDPAGRCAVTDLPADECRHCRWGENDADPPPPGLTERLLSKMTVTTTDALPEGVAMVIGPDASFRLAADAAEARRERDEARAEVERLRKGLNGLIDALDMTMAAAHEAHVRSGTAVIRSDYERGRVHALDDIHRMVRPAFNDAVRAAVGPLKMGDAIEQPERGPETSEREEP